MFLFSVTTGHTTTAPLTPQITTHSTLQTEPSLVTTTQHTAMSNDSTIADIGENNDTVEDNDDTIEEEDNSSHSDDVLDDEDEGKSNNMTTTGGYTSAQFSTTTAQPDPTSTVYVQNNQSPITTPSSSQNNTTTLKSVATVSTKATAPNSYQYKLCIIESFILEEGIEYTVSTPVASNGKYPLNMHCEMTINNQNGKVK